MYNPYKPNAVKFYCTLSQKTKVITEDFSLARDVPLGKAEYTYNVLTILNSKAPYETKRLKIQFLIDLDAEKAAEKHRMSNVRKFIFKKHPDLGRVHILSQDTHLFLPYDLTACRHLLFLCSSPRADNQEEKFARTRSSNKISFRRRTNICPNNGERKL